LAPAGARGIQMMSYPQLLERRLLREKFDPTWLGIPVNPFYIIRKRLVDAIRSSASQFSGDILDFGCGSKPYEALFARSRSYVGTDIETSGHSHHDSRVDYFYDGKTLPFADATFDHVVSFEVFEHVFNIPDVLKEINRVLRPHGVLFFSIPFAWGEHEKPYDFGRYTSFGITHVVEENGFKIERIVKTNTDIEAIVQLFATYLYESVAPRERVLKSIFQICAIAPLTIFGLVAGRIMPNAGQIYSNMVITATKV
jgi:SAM-dependent methyltransferase